MGVLKTTKIYKKLAWFNELPADEAEYVLLECQVSMEWAQVLAAERPFAMLEPLFDRAKHMFFAIDRKCSNGSDLNWIDVERNIGKLLER